MCLLLLAFNVTPDRPWLLLGNRDEFHGRASAPAQAWIDAPDVVGGRDLEAGGTWLALHRNGRFAAVTNVRNGQPRRGPRSRGELVAGFVRGIDTPSYYAAAIARHSDEYGPFNLIVGDRRAAAGASSALPQSWAFGRGLHVLSNGPPGADWPKVRRLRERFAALLQSVEVDKASVRDATPSGAGDASSHGWPDDAVLLDLLGDIGSAPDAELPDTGVGVELERRLAPIFIVGSQYGTRASTLAYARGDGSCVLVERGFGPDGVALGEARVRTPPAL
jgi:uncharacterized protein with NRDE domain